MIKEMMKFNEREREICRGVFAGVYETCREARRKDCYTLPLMEMAFGVAQRIIQKRKG